MSIVAALITAGIPALTVLVGLFVNLRSAKRLRLLVLKSLIINSELPLQERLDVYSEYKKCGGNGWADIYYNECLIQLIRAEIRQLKGGA
jgi:hypothetical protein